jgi:hypothetical protein
LIAANSQAKAKFFSSPSCECKGMRRHKHFDIRDHCRLDREPDLCRLQKIAVLELADVQQACRIYAFRWRWVHPAMLRSLP